MKCQQLSNSAMLMICFSRRSVANPKTIDGYSKHIQILFSQGEAMTNNLHKFQVESSKNETIFDGASKSSKMKTTLVEKVSRSREKTRSNSMFANKLSQILKSLLKKQKKKAAKMQIKMNAASFLKVSAVVNGKIKSYDTLIKSIVAGSSNPLIVNDHCEGLLKAAQLKEVQEIE